MTENLSENINVRVSQAEKERLQRASEVLGVKPSKLVRMAIEKTFNRKKFD
jgi:antitoxin component of RelBE/YafQ-DinJ toxin-antitoxin module